MSEDDKKATFTKTITLIIVIAVCTVFVGCAGCFGCALILSASNPGY